MNVLLAESIADGKKATTEKIGAVNALLFVGGDAECGLKSKQPKKKRRNAENNRGKSGKISRFKAFLRV